MSASDPAWGLVGDIGGTNARFALVGARGGSFAEPVSVRCAEFPTLEAAIESYLSARVSATRPQRIALAVAGPVQSGAVRMTNNPWRISEAGLVQAGFKSARLLNDYEALALAFADPDQAPATRRIGPPIPADPEAPLLVMGAGTGFGLGALVGRGRQATAIATEAGHIGLAPADETEVQVWRRLASKFGRASVERALSGVGLVNLHTALSDGAAAPEEPRPEEVTIRAEDGDPLAVAAVRMFFVLLARTAGDLALSYGAFGGVHLSGGVVARLSAMLDAGAFRTAFEDKGRFSDYMRRVPTTMIEDPLAALIGAAHTLRR